MFLLTECPGNNLKPPCLFSLSGRQSVSDPNFFNPFHQYLPLNSQASSLLLESSFSKGELSPVTVATCFLWPWVVNQRGLGPAAAVYLLCDTYQKSDSSHYWHLLSWTVSSGTAGISSCFSLLPQGQAVIRRDLSGPVGPGETPLFS